MLLHVHAAASRHTDAEVEGVAHIDYGVMELNAPIGVTIYRIHCKKMDPQHMLKCAGHDRLFTSTRTEPAANPVHPLLEESTRVYRPWAIQATRTHFTCNVVNLKNVTCESRRKLRLHGTEVTPSLQSQPCT